MSLGRYQVLVTIEDILEQIVGDIEDEFDGGRWSQIFVSFLVIPIRVRALTDIDDFNAQFNTHFG